MLLAKEAWRLYEDKLTNVSKYNPIYRRLDGKDCIDFTNVVGDLNFEFEFYSTRPKRQNGSPIWDRVVPYNSCYLPDDGKKEVSLRELNPVEMWLEDRWIFVRRIYGSTLAQKLFIQCLNFIYGLNGIRGAYFHAIQNAIVRELFDLEPKDFFAEINKDTWVHFWDQRAEGFITQNTAHYLAKRINMMGPTAAIFGKDFELFMLEEETFTTCPVEILIESIRTCRGTLNRQSFENDNRWQKASWSQSNWTADW